MSKFDRLKEQKKRDAKRAEREAKLLEKEQKQEVEDGTPVEEEITEPIEKDYDNPSVVVSMGPTSFSELDAMKLAQEQAREVRELSWNVQDLVWNIVGSVLMSPEDKAKAIGQVGTDFGKRIKKVSGEKVEKSIDMDALELQVILAKHKRSAGMIEKAKEWIGKVRIDSESPYPIETKNEVLFSLEKMVKSLGDNPEGEDRKLIPQIKEAAKNFDIASLDAAKNSIVIEKDKNGVYRAVMWPSNNFQDFDGDIISKAAHEEYVEWVNQNMNLAPVFTIWHKPKFIRKNRVDFAGYENGFLIMSAPLEKEEAAGLLRAQLVTDQGMSHGTIPLAWRFDKDGTRIIEKYRMVEVSDLPLENAANPFTDFEIISKEAQMDTKKYLAQFIGEEQAEEFIEKGGLKQAALQKAGVKEAEKSETPVTENKDTPAQKSPAGAPTPVLDMDALVKAVGDKYDLAGLSEFLQKQQEEVEKVPVLEALLKDRIKNQDELLAEQISPSNNTLIWQKSRSSEKPANVLDEEKEEDRILKKSVPQVSEGSWFSEITGVAPIQQ